MNNLTIAELTHELQSLSMEMRYISYLVESYIKDLSDLRYIYGKMEKAQEKMSVLVGSRIVEGDHETR